MLSRQFYERYWKRPGSAIPEVDDTTEQRKRLLANSLHQLLPALNGSNHAPARVLDAGCGNGEFSVFIEQLGFQVYGTDLATGAIEKAKRQSPTIGFSVASVEEGLPYRAEEFSAIWNTEVIEHLFDIHACLSEFNRILRDRGVLVLTTPFHGLIKNVIVSTTSFDRHFDPYISHIRFFDKHSLSKCLKNAGFEPISWCGVGRFWPVYKSFFVVSKKMRLPNSAPDIAG